MVRQFLELLKEKRIFRWNRKELETKLEYEHQGFGERNVIEQW